MAETIANATKTHEIQIVDRPFPDTYWSNITDKLIRFAFPAYKKVYSLIQLPEPIEEKPFLTGFRIVLTISILALCMILFMAYKPIMKRYKAFREAKKVATYTTLVETEQSEDDFSSDSMFEDAINESFSEESENRSDIDFGLDVNYNEINEQEPFEEFVDIETDNGMNEIELPRVDIDEFDDLTASNSRPRMLTYDVEPEPEPEPEPVNAIVKPKKTVKRKTQKPTPIWRP